MGTAMPWLLLTLAGVFEIAWAVGLKYTDGFTRLWPSVFTVVTMIASFWLLSLAARSIPLGTAYAVWTGIGVLGTTFLGIVLFREARDWSRLMCIGLVLIGIVGLKLLTPKPD